jgi:hypothetical protein
MHAPWSEVRTARLASLVAALGGADVVSAMRGAGVWDTARRAWLAHAPGATHHLVVQDDAEPCALFRERVLDAIAARPAHVVTLYTHRAREVASARERGAAWCWGPDAVYGVASLLPVAWIAPFLAWEREHVRADYPHDDNRLGLWARATGRGVWTTCPQLVDHASLPSTLRHRWTQRAPWPAGDDDIHWERGTADPVRIPLTVPARHALIDPTEVCTWPKPSRS